MTDRLHDFARAVATRQAEVDEGVDEDTMLAIARDMGMSDEDVLAARAEGQARQERARGLRQRGLYDEAIVELEQAHAWNPLDVTIMTQFADCLVRRGRAKQSADDYARAQRLCQLALRAAPADNEAPALLQTMKMNPLADPATSKSGLWLGIGIAVVLLLTGLVFAFGFAF